MPANTREIRSRIKSVKNTQQITRALQMVAAAKIRRAQDRVTAAKPYAERIAEVFKQVASQLSPGDFKSPLLVTRPVQRVAIVAITSDKGLSGAYNANAIRAAVNAHREWRERGAEVELIVVGQKGVSFFRHSNFNVVSRYTQLPQIPTFAEATAIAKEATERFASGQVDHVELVYTNFRSMLSLVPTTQTLLPAVLPTSEGPRTASALYEFEPEPEVVMNRIIPKYLETVVYQALLESAACQLAAQMTAMSAASKNAKELAAALTLVYNKARQAAITQEILEVVGGANAL
ncbi:MAG TPA: ATP synthase F1 subunit gamma [Oscillatoriaceae cyanobacterium]